MRYLLLFGRLFLGLPLLIPVQIHACGYDWIGDCSCNLHLRINGTLDSFNLAKCPSGLNAQGMYLGELRTLSLANAHAITWESCQNNVTNAALKYRIYEQGGGAGSFLDYTLEQDYFTQQGPYTTRYQSKAGNVDLTAGLSPGKTYILEVYMLALVDTIGDDFVPETLILSNNSGQNYQLRFVYAGPDGAPFVALPTVVLPPRCNGESNGQISISVWGDQTGIFYEWSNMPLNFYQQSNLIAGTYSVTISGVNHTEILTITLEQPPSYDTLLLHTLPEQVLVTCNTPATPICAVDLPDAEYQWYKDGVPTLNTPCANAAAGGIYRLELHWKGCLGIKEVAVEEHLIDPTGQITGLAPIGCAGPPIPVVLHAQTQAYQPQFVWTYNGQVLSTADSCVFGITEFEPGPLGIPMPVVPELLITDGYGCTGTATNTVILVETSPPFVLLSSTPPSGQNASDGTVQCQVIGGTPPFSIVWSNGTTDDTLQGLPPGLYCVTITDNFACSAEACVQLMPNVSTNEPDFFGIEVFPNPVRSTALLHIQLNEFQGPDRPRLMLTSANGLEMKRFETAEQLQNNLFSTLADVPPGIYVLRVLLKSGWISKKITVISDN